MNKTAYLTISKSQPVVKNHLVYGQALLPGMAYIDMLFQLARQAVGLDYNTSSLKRLSISHPLTVGEDQPVKLRITFNRTPEHWKVTVERMDTGVIYITAEFHEEAALFNHQIRPETIMRNSKKVLSIDTVYNEAREKGLVHQGMIKARGDIFLTDAGCLIDIYIDETYKEESRDTLFHPAIIDGAAMATGVLERSDLVDGSSMYLPLYFESFSCIEPLNSHCYVIVNRSSFRDVNDITSMDLEFFNEEGQKVGQLKELTSKLVRSKGQINPGLKEKNNGKIFDYIEKQLRNIFSKYMYQAAFQIDPDTGFFEAGLESSQLLAVLKDIELFFELSLNPTLLFENSNLRSLIEYLKDKVQIEETCGIEDNKAFLTRGEANLEKIYVFSEDEPFLRDHLVYEQPALMGVVHPCLVMEAFLENNPGAYPLLLEDVRFQGGPVTLREGEKAHIQVKFDSEKKLFETFFYLSDPGKISSCCKGKYHGAINASHGNIDIDAVLNHSKRIDPDIVAGFYRSIRDFNIGPMLKTIESAYIYNESTIISKVCLDGKTQKGGVPEFVFDPLLLNSCYFFNTGDKIENNIMVPLMIEKITLFRAMTRTAYIINSAGTRKPGFISFDALVLTAEGDVIAEISNASVKEVLEPDRLTNARFEAPEPSPVIGNPVKTGPLDVAIVGMAGRYPQCRDINSFLESLRDGKDCITEIPGDRWDWREYYSEDRTKPGHVYSKWGGFIEDADMFDPLFFKISPSEAERMDPQERLFLQHCWMALEDAGYTRSRLKKITGSNVGVYAGVMSQEYSLFAAEALVRGKRIGMSAGISSIATRISYFCDFHGPSIAVDTMCSSSLTTIYMACQELRSGKIKAALVGGVNLTLHPNKYLMLSDGHFISSTGHCESFGVGGDGYIPGEGVGVLFLKSVADAERDGDHIYGVIKGAAINHGGKAGGYTVPNPGAQAMVVSGALEEAGIDPETITYIEAHGTGTKLGDPVEVAGLCRVFDKETDKKSFCRIGSVKSNIGHCESAAGVAGVTKILLQMKHGQIFPSLHSEILNPNINFEQTPFIVNQKLRNWDRCAANGREIPRRAGISSFGASGANAHLIIEEYIPTVSSREPVVYSDAKPAIVPLSAQSEENLTAYAGELLDFLKNGLPGPEPEVKENLLEFVRNEIVSLISETGNIEKSDIDPGQEFAEINVDYIHLNKIQQLLRDKWGIDLSLQVFTQSRSINELAACLIEKYKHEFENNSGIQAIAGFFISPDINLADLAYTFQVGREPMRHRMLFLVKDINELIQKLEAFIQGEKNIDGCISGKTGREKEFITDFTSDDDIAEAIQRWVRKGKFSRLAKLWTGGMDVDWDELYTGNKPRRISAPVYPFAGERYWVMGAGKNLLTSACAFTEKGSVIHPVLQENISDLSEQCFRSRFTGEEFFLRDHRVNGQRVLPGVVYLEMAQEAVKRGSGMTWEAGMSLQLKNVVWARPVTVSEEPAEVNIGLFPGEDGQIGYEIYSGNSVDEEEVLVHGQGAALFIEAEASSLDLAGLKERLKKNIPSPGKCYELFNSMGIEYGPSQRGLDEVYAGEKEVLAHLRLPLCVSETRDRYTLHPSLVDSALQASIAIGLEEDDVVSGPPALPFALEKLEIIGGRPEPEWAWIRLNGESGPGRSSNFRKLDMDLCDREGRVCVKMRGLSSRVAEGRQQRKEDFPGLLLVKPGWKEKPLFRVQRAVEYTEYYVYICGFKGKSVELEEKAAHIIFKDIEYNPRIPGKGFEGAAVVLFESIKSILEKRVEGRVLIQVLAPIEGPGSLFFGLSGLLKTANKENPRITGQVIGLCETEKGEGILDILKENSQHPGDTEVRYEEGKRSIRIFSELPGTEGEVPWKSGGVYLITGGAGGLGRIFAREIAGRVDRGTLILTGRREVDREKREQLKELEKLGMKAEYRAVDVCDGESLEGLVEEIRNDFGGLNGIIHSAGVVRDNFILKKDVDEFKEVLAPKVEGLLNLDRLTGDWDLDIFVLFSSGAGVMGNAGQSDYSAANGFMDAFSSYRNSLLYKGERRGRTLSINWPLWKEGGMGVSEKLIRQMKEQTGLVPLETASGLNAFYAGLALDDPQVMVMEGDVQRLSRLIRAGEKAGESGDVKGEAAEKGSGKRDREIAAEGAGVLEDRTLAFFKQEFSKVLKLPARRIDAGAPLEEYGIDSIMAMDLTNVLEKSFGSLSKTLFFEYRSIDEIGRYFLENHRQVLEKLLMPEKEEKGLLLPPESDKPAEKSAPVKVVSKRRVHKRFRVMEFSSRESPGTGPLDIAVIGLSGRYPRARNLEEYWENLYNGRDCVTEIPKERWDWREYYTEDRSLAGYHYSKWGGFIEDVDMFDPLFFHISPMEAELLDPQERLFLQHCWTALEDAGYRREDLKGKEGEYLAGQVGVYAGVMFGHYQLFGVEECLRGNPTAVGGSHASVANRVSYILNLHGPSMTVDTMCSSSLTTLHLACQDLRNNRTDLGIAGGVNVSIHPNKYLMLSSGQFISSRGRCESFGDGGDGYIPGEGVGAAILKRLADAERDGDHIYGVIKGSALSHGGRTNGYSVPNPHAQREAIARAVKESGIDPAGISYIEAHGTGTKLGDPIEIKGLDQAFDLCKDEGPLERQYCRIGSVKSNIGHCEGAAGIAGVTKVLLQMKHGFMVPSLHSEVLNPHINFGETPFMVNRELLEWKRPRVKGKEFPRVAGISGFGAGGSNAHVVIEEYISPGREKVVSHPVTLSDPALIVLSAKSGDRLRAYSKNLLDFVRRNRNNGKSVKLRDLAYTLQVGRESMEERLAIIVYSMNDLEDKLTKFLEEKEDSEIFLGQVKRDKGTLALFAVDEDLQTAMEAWIGKRKYNKLLDLWVNGLIFDWNRIYGQNKPGKISAPVYPFAGEKYWVPGRKAPGVSQNISRSFDIHPMIHKNVSDFSGYRFRSDFTGREFFLADHVYNGIRIMPGAGYLEMVRAAVAYAAGIEEADGVFIQLRDILWIKPLALVDGNLKVFLDLVPGDNGEIVYEIYSDPVNRGSDVFSRGRILLSEEKPPFPETKDLQALKLQCDEKILSTDECYKLFNAMGIDYGRSFRGIGGIYSGAGSTGVTQFLAKIELPLPDCNAFEDYKLHPGLMDSASQAVIGFFYADSPSGSGNTTAPGGMGMPFALGALEIYKKCTPAMWAFIRPKEGLNDDPFVKDFDIDLYDEQGQICVLMKGLSLRSSGGISEKRKISAGKTKPVKTGLLLLHPSWKERVLPGQTGNSRYTEHLVFLCEQDNTSPERIEKEMPGVRCLELKSGEKDVARRFKDYAVRVLEEIRNIIQSEPEGKVLVQFLFTFHEEKQLLIGLEGLLKTARFEVPLIIGRLVGIEPGMSLLGKVRKLKENALSSFNNATLYKKGKSLSVEWDVVEDLKSGSPWKDKGVYLIIGGTGGLGFIFAREILKQVKDAVLVLTGRSVLNPEKQKKFEELQLTGGKVIYKQIDTTIKEQAVELIESIKNEYGEPRGIIYSAGLIRDSLIYNKDVTDFNEVLEPKVPGLVNLDRAGRDLSLDFFILFSSLSAVMGNQGQCDYSTANAFMDAYAVYRNSLVASGQRYGRTLSVNWSQWKFGGMQIYEDVEAMMLEEMGITFMDSSTGIRALYQCYNSGYDQVLVVEGDIPRVKAYLSKIEGFEKLRTEDEIEEIFSTGTTGDTAVAVEKEKRGGLLNLEQSLERDLKEHISKLLKIPYKRLNREVNLAEFGFNSISLGAFATLIANTYEILINPALLFKHFTLEKLTIYLLTKHKKAIARFYGKDIAVEPEFEAPEQLDASKSPKRRSFVIPEKAAISAGGESRPGVPEPIAVIGMSGRFPKAGNVEEFWENIAAGKNCITDFYAERQDLLKGNQYFDFGKRAAGWGGFLNHIDRFDPLFFGISPKEAEYIDPKQRLFLEEAWRTFEDAGYMGDRVRGISCGVYAGVEESEYGYLTGANNQVNTNQNAALPARIAYSLDLKGPNMALTAACSSGLVAVHQACQALRQGDCEMALAGGVNLIVSPGCYIVMSEIGLISPDGLCCVFDQKANGMVPGEAVAVVLLKPLSKAIRDKDRIYGCIKASGVNYDGKTNGLSAPNPMSQEELIKGIYRKYKINPENIRYIMPHSLGSKLGDSIEIQALTGAFNSFTEKREYCSIGSVKPLVGHSFAASGVVSLIGMLMAMKHKTIPGMKNYETCNEYIDFKESPFFPGVEKRVWECGKGCRRMGTISTTGITGTNAHAVIEEFISEKHVIDISTGGDLKERDEQLIILSAKSPDRLDEIARQMVRFIESREPGEVALADLAYTLQVGRDAMEYRFATVVESMEELLRVMKAYPEYALSTSIPVYTGNLEEDSTVRDLVSGRSGEALVNVLLAEKNLSKMALHWTQGGGIPWEEIHKGKSVRRIALPTYPFSGERYWVGLDNTDPVDKNELTGKIEPPGPEKSPRDEIVGFLINSLSRELKIPAGTIKFNKNIADYGVDSIVGLKLMRRLGGKFQLKITGREMLEHTTVNALSDHLCAKLSGREGSAGRRGSPAGNETCNEQKKKQDSPVTEFLKELISRELLIPPEAIETGKDFMDYGVDSITRFKIQRGVEEEFQIGISGREMLKCATIENLVGCLEKKRTSRSVRTPLSEGQKGLWVLQKMSPGMSAYNVPIALCIKHRIDEVCFEKACDFLVRQYPVLGMVIREENGIPYQIPVKGFSFQRERINSFVGLKDNKLISYLRRKSKEPFNFETGPLMRIHLMSCHEEEYIVLITLHHIIFDGSSILLLVGSLFDAYFSYRLGKEPPLSLPADYREFVKWEQEMLESREGEEHLQYWKKQLSGELPVLSLPADHLRSPVNGFTGKTHEVVIPQSLGQRLRDLARSFNTNLSVLFLGIFKVLLYKYTGQEDILVGMPTAGRPEERFEKAIGYFVNMIVVRSTLSGESSFSDFLKELRLTVVDGLDHSVCPFPVVVRELKIKRDRASAPVFQVSYAYQNFIQPSIFKKIDSKTTLPIELLAGIHQEGEDELGLEVFDGMDHFKINFEYNPGLFEPATIRRMADHYINLAEEISTGPAKAIRNLEMLSVREKEQVISGWNGPGKKEAPGLPVHKLFEARAKENPGAAALIFTGPGDRRMTYGELNEKAGGLASRLKSLDIKPGFCIGLCMERSPEMIIALLAVLKAGGVYVPLDPGYPEDRLKFILQDTGMKALLTDNSERIRRISDDSLTVIDVYHDKRKTKGESILNHDVAAGIHDPAYIIYTSGSTGTPKGVVISHEAIAEHCRVVRDYYKLTARDHILQFASINVDASLEQILPGLTTGATIVLRDRELWTPADFYKKMKEYNLSVIDIPPGYLRELLLEWASFPGPFSPGGALRLVIVGGEALLPGTLKLWRKSPLRSVLLINAYGPTEATITSTAFKIDEESWNEGFSPNIPIGRPLGNRRAYILDPGENPLPEGVPGELYIAGPGLSPGYLNRPGMTAEKFIPDPFIPGTAGERMYRTGDRARYIPGTGGLIEFLGRIDRQMKIRGFRIEPGEIESMLLKHDAVKDCAVVAGENRDAGVQLAAYIVLNPGMNGVTGDSLIIFLKDKVPAPLLPSVCMILDELPLTPAGKVDYQNLPEPVEKRVAVNFTPPRNPVEKKLASIWAGILGLSEVGIYDDFFEIGGHSILSVRLMSAIEKVFGKSLFISTLVEGPTIAQQAKLLEGQITTAKNSLLVCLQSEGEGPPFFFVHPVGGDVHSYMKLARELGKERPFYGIRSPGLEAGEPPCTIEEIASTYIEAVRKIQAKGPYHIGGWSMGGVVSFEMARQFEEAGDKVNLLALVASQTPAISTEVEKYYSKLYGMDGRDQESFLYFSFAGYLSGILNKEIPEDKEINRDEMFNEILLEAKKKDLLPDIDSEQVQKRFKVFKANTLAMNHYTLKSYNGPIFLFNAKDEAAEDFHNDRTRGWGELGNRNLLMYDIPGNHFTILQGPNVEVLAGELRKCFAHK